MPGGVLMTPRPLPRRTIPALAAVGALALALPIFVVAGWDVRGWALGALLWVATRALSLLVAHARRDATTTAASGLQAFELTLKGLVVLVVLVAVAATNPDLALSAALVFILAYTVELGLALASYFGGSK